MSDNNRTLKNRSIYTHFFVLLFLFFSFYSFFMNPAFTFLGGLHSAMLLWPLSVLVIHPRVYSGWKKQKGIFFSWMFVFLYVIFRTILGGDAGIVSIWISILIEIVLVSFVLVRLTIIHSVNFENMLLSVVSLAGVISCLCLIFPDINTFTKSILVNSVEVEDRYSFRGFGIGDGLTFTYGVSLGTICAMGICTIRQHKWFIVFIPIVTLAVLVNARIGFVPIALAIIFVAVYSKNIIQTIMIIIVALFVIILLWNSYIEDLLPGRTTGWMLKFFTEVGEGGQGETMSILLNAVVLPDSFEEWFLGKGVNVFYLTGSYRTDIGYFIQLCYGGIFYCVLLWIMVIQIVVPAYKYMPRSFFWTLIISMLLENYKGDFIGRNSAFCCFVVIMVYYAQLNKRQKMIAPYYKK